MTRIAPQRMSGQVLGLWFLATAFGDKLAGDIGGAFTASDPDGLALSFLAQAGLVAGRGSAYVRRHPPSSGGCQKTTKVKHSQCPATFVPRPGGSARLDTRCQPWRMSRVKRQRPHA